VLFVLAGVLRIAGMTISRLTSSYSRLLLLMLVLSALGLRVHRLGAQSLWYDEAVTARVASRGVAELTRWTAEDIQPPLYYYIEAGWTRLGGRGEWALRFPSVFAGVLIVPALWTLARRLFGCGLDGWIAALVAAALAAFSPLYVYYSQEARMYTQLTLLGILAGYALLRAMAARPCRSEIVWWTGFVLCGAAMLYTHYFGAFLLLAYGLWFVISWTSEVARAPTRRRAARSLGFAVGSALAIGALYLPWLPAMLTRYRVDRSYWEGALKLGEALRHVAISFTSGAPETMLEADAIRLLPWFGLVFAVSVILLAGSRSAQVAATAPGADETAKEAGEAPNEQNSGLSPLWYLLVVLFVPVIAVLAVASRTPKFNARYLMLASPAYLLVLAGGIGARVGGRWSSPKGVDASSIRKTRTVMRFWLGMVPMVFLAIAAMVSLHNWFSDPAFTKAQWRELAATVRANKVSGEAVLLVSGHAWPAWEYYAPDIPATRLPEIDILDVNAALDLRAGSILDRALRDRAGAWLVSWQTEAVDPLGVVPYFLDRAGVEQASPGQFWHVGLRHWALRPGATYPASPEPEQRLGANYGHRIALLGWDNPRNGQLTVYWQALQPLDRDYQVSLVLEDETGKELGRWDGRPAGYEYPAQRWEVGEAVLGRYDLPLPADAPRGDYYVTLAVYDPAEPSGLDIMDVADNPAGKRIRLGPFRLE
jgi:4-amino-4-deoxy-L-arabinose transferase-like glycosyltransferase